MSSLAPPVAPWYRHRWPWLLISGPAVAVVASLASAWLAVHGADPIVDSDYYRHGLQVNADIARSERARAVGLGAAFGLEGIGAGDEVRVAVRSAVAMPSEPTVEVRLIDPDRAVVLRRAILGRVAGSGAEETTYLGAWQPAADDAAELAKSVASGLLVQVDGRDWRVEGQLPAGSTAERSFRLEPLHP